MRKSRILFTLMAAFTLWVAVVSCGFATLSSQSVVYAQGLASAHAKQPQPPKAPDLGRFTPTLTIPTSPAPAPWKPQTSTAVAYNNRDLLTTSAGQTKYTYDATTHTELTQKTAPDGTSTAYTYDTSGNLLQQVVTPPGGGATQTTSYSYDGANRLSGLAEPDGTSIAYTYNASGQRASVTTTPPVGSGGSATTVTDAYQLGHLAYQTDGAGTLLASYTDDASGVPESVQVGSDPATALRYYYVYDARGDVVNLTDASGAVVASYAYDTWGALTSASESIPNANGWVNPYRYDGRDGGGRRCCRGRRPRRAAARRG